MKKMICVLLSLTTAISLCACTETGDDQDYRDDDRDYAEGIREYDQAGRLSKITNYDNYQEVNMVCTYSYNDNGEHFVKTREAMEYTYETGVAVSGVYTDQTYGEWYNFSYGVFDTWVNFETVDNYTFSYDQTGRLITEICHHGNTMTYNTDGNKRASQRYCHHLHHCLRRLHHLHPRKLRPILHKDVAISIKI